MTRWVQGKTFKNKAKFPYEDLELERATPEEAVRPHLRHRLRPYAMIAT